MSFSHSSTTALFPFLVVIAIPKRRVFRENSEMIRACAALERGCMRAERKITSEKSHIRPYRVAVWFHTLGILHRVWDNNNLEVASIKT